MSDQTEREARHDIWDDVTHPCGCRTYFDVALWRSADVVRCPAHIPPPRSSDE